MNFFNSRKPKYENSTDKSRYSCYHHYQHCNMQTNKQKKKIEKEKKRKRKRKKKKEYNFSEGNFPFSLSALIHLTVTQ